MPWIFEAVLEHDGWSRYAGKRHLLDAETQQILNMAAHDGKTEVTFPSDDADAPFTEVYFETSRLIMKLKTYRLIGKWSGDGTSFSISNARYFRMYGDIIGNVPKPIIWDSSLETPVAERKPVPIESDLATSIPVRESVADPIPDSLHQWQ